MQLITTNKPAKSYNSFYLLGKRYFDVQNYSFAKKLLLKAIQKNPDLIEGYFYLGLCCYFLGEKGNAIHYLQHFVNESNIKKQSANALDTIGKCYQELGNSDKALDYYNSAIKANQECSSAWHNMGLLYMESAVQLIHQDLSTSMRIFSGAKKFLSEAMKLVSDNPVFLHSVASWYEAYVSALQELNQDESTKASVVKCFELAISYYNRASSLNDNESLRQTIRNNLAECLAQFGHFHYRQESYEAAIVQYQSTLKIAPSHLVSLNQVGMSYFKQGKFRLAIEYFTKSLNYSTTDEDKADSLLNIACAFRELKEYDNARLFLNQAKELSPEDMYIIEEENNLRGAISVLAASGNSFFDAPVLPGTTQEAPVRGLFLGQ